MTKSYKVIFATTSVLLYNNEPSRLKRSPPFCVNVGVMRFGAAEATGLGFVLLLSTLMCCQPRQLIWAFLFYILFNFTPPPQTLKTQYNGLKTITNKDLKDAHTWAIESVGEGDCGFV